MVTHNFVRMTGSSPQPIHMTSRRSGFTMLEVVVVLLITGIVAGLAIPRIDITRYKADAVVTSVRSAMQQAQRASLVAQYDVIVSFDITGGRIRIAWDANNDHYITT